MKVYYGTSAGNVIVISKTVGDRVHLDRVGHFDGTESRTMVAEQWGTMAKDWFDSAVKSGFFFPLVLMIGGAWQRETDYIDSITA